jgi:cytochrome c5
VSQQEKSLFTTFAAVLGFLVVLAFVFYFVAQTVVSGKGDDAGENTQAAQTADENIKPVGSVVVAGASTAGAAAAGPRAGADVFNGFCMACHGTGAAGAPKVGDKAAWAPRIAQGMDILHTHAVAGIRAMPPRGTCAACSDDDLKAAVDYMVGESK